MHAIEVYPAATLAAHGIDARGYKASSGGAHRERVLSELRQRLTVHASVPDIDRAPDGFDALLCILAAHDFLVGATITPDGNMSRELSNQIALLANPLNALDQAFY